MRVEQVFNPLDKRNLGTSVADALLNQPRSPLPPPQRFVAAGVYAIYYQGKFKAYSPIAARNALDNGKDVPIYVGKAVPRGARKGGLGMDAAPGTVLFDRLVEHAESIGLAENLKAEDFYCRYLAVDDIWIPLGENLLIEMFSPLWNRVIDGFGNHDPGSGRHQGKIPAWDVIHPGRSWAKKLQSGKQLSNILEDVTAFWKKHLLGA
jgi:hypothetical protein